MTKALAALNALANDPEVLPNIAPGESNLDMSDFFTDPQNIMVGNEDGASIFIWHAAQQAYEVHYLFTHRMKGRAILRALTEASDFVFTHTAARAIFGLTPDDNPRARLVNRAMGGAAVGPMFDCYGRPCTQYILTREVWAASLAGQSALRAAFMQQTNRHPRSATPRTRPDKLH